MKEFEDLVDIISRLRKECPWDREQTHESLAKHLIEEAYELLDALAAIQTNPENHNMLNEELGDLLLQILLHSKIAEENKYFSIVDVVTNLQEKLIKRHPHVFGDVELESAEDVEKQWEEIKKQETSDSIFDDIDQKFFNNFQLIISSYGTSWPIHNNQFISWLKKNKTLDTWIQNRNVNIIYEKDFFRNIS